MKRLNFYQRLMGAVFFLIAATNLVTYYISTSSYKVEINELKKENKSLKKDLNWWEGRQLDEKNPNRGKGES